MPEGTSIVLEEGTVSITSYAFEDCSGLTSVIIPNSVKSIGGSAFYNCAGLTSVTIPNNVISIGSSVFYGCSALTSVTIPNSVTSIGAYAFADCSALGSIVIPNSVASIGNSAFSGCTDLTDVYCYATDVPKATNYSFDNPASSTLHVPASSLEAYRATGPWSRFGTIVALTDEEVGIKAIDNGQLTIDNAYDLSGRQQRKMQKGINIIRMSNGTTRKVLVK